MGGLHLQVCPRLFHLRRVKLLVLLLGLSLELKAVEVVKWALVSPSSKLEQGGKDYTSIMYTSCSSNLLLGQRAQDNLCITNCLRRDEMSQYLQDRINDNYQLLGERGYVVLIFLFNSAQLSANQGMFLEKVKHLQGLEGE